MHRRVRRQHANRDLLAVELLASWVEHCDIEKEGRNLRGRHPKTLLESLREARKPSLRRRIEPD